MKSSYISFLAAAAILVSGCEAVITAGDPKPDDPDYAPAQPVETAKNVIPTGSIFLDGGANSIYSDIKAHKVGDLISVTLDESTSASKSASTKTQKSSSTGLDGLMLGGNTVKFGGKYTTEASFGGNNAFNAKANAGQTNSLSGQISVSVIKVLPNGNLMIRGEKWLMLNNGNEYIRLTGILRPEDVNADNTVSSQKVANARIQYGGTGDFANTQKRGWLSRFFNSIFNPF